MVEAWQTLPPRARAIILAVLAGVVILGLLIVAQPKDSTPATTPHAPGPTPANTTDPVDDPTRDPQTPLLAPLPIPETELNRLVDMTLTVLPILTNTATTPAEKTAAAAAYTDNPNLVTASRIDTTTGTEVAVATFTRISPVLVQLVAVVGSTPHLVTFDLGSGSGDWKVAAVTATTCQQVACGGASG